MFTDIVMMFSEPLLQILQQFGMGIGQPRHVQYRLLAPAGFFKVVAWRATPDIIFPSTYRM